MHWMNPVPCCTGSISWWAQKEFRAQNFTLGLAGRQKKKKHVWLPKWGGAVKKSSTLIAQCNWIWKKFTACACSFLCVRLYSFFSLTFEFDECRDFLFLCTCSPSRSVVAYISQRKCPQLTESRTCCTLLLCYFYQWIRWEKICLISVVHSDLCRLLTLEKLTLILLSCL